MAQNRGSPNPKALKLEGLEKVTKKVTTGFKCHPELKLHLAMEAKKLGLTLSEFIETYLQQTDNAIQQEQIQNEALRLQLAFYENNSLLIKWFKEYEGKEVTFTNAEGKNETLRIKSIEDIFEVIINSFKSKP